MIEHFLYMVTLLEASISEKQLYIIIPLFLKLMSFVIKERYAFEFFKDIISDSCARRQARAPATRYGGRDIELLLSLKLQVRVPAMVTMFR